MDTPAALSGTMRKLRRLALRALVACVAGVALYFGAAELLTRLPVNAEAEPLDGTIDVYLVSNGVHVDL